MSLHRYEALADVDRKGPLHKNRPDFIQTLLAVAEGQGLGSPAFRGEGIAWTNTIRTAAAAIRHRRWLA